jgi:hypothetical protein
MKMQLLTLALLAASAAKAVVSIVEPSIVHVMVTSTVTVQPSESAVAIPNVNARYVVWESSEPVWYEPTSAWTEPVWTPTSTPESLSPVSTSTNSTPGMPQSHKQTAMIVGIVIASIAVAFAIFGVLYTLYVRHRNPFRTRKARIHDMELNAR